jgi:hypothetical protein
MLRLIKREFAIMTLLALVALLLGCSSSRDSRDVGSGENTTVEEPSPTTIVESELPPTIDPASLASATEPVELPQLVGLTEEQAALWAERSGFVLVRQEDADEGALAPSLRVVVEVEDGVIVRATAG